MPDKARTERTAYVALLSPTTTKKFEGTNTHYQLSFLMIRLFTASLFLAGVVVAHREPSDAHPKQRKSLGFGPILPHTFQTTPHRAPSFVPPNPSACPFETAQQFVDELLGGQSDYAIRDDSYTDKNTGVTHVYVRQLVNGLEVVDGDINLNVKNGVVLSWGNSV